MLQAVAFDLDWTLSYYPLSTTDVLREALVRCDCPRDLLGDLDGAAECYNARWLQWERTILDAEPLRRRIVASLLADAEATDLSLAVPIAAAYGEVRRESGVFAFPGVDRLLADLKGQYRLGLLTNGQSRMQWEKIHALGFDETFDVILVAGEIGLYKPDTRIFARLLHELGVRARAALFVGDSYDTDIVGAGNAGMRTAWIAAEDEVASGEVQPTLRRSQVTQLRGDLL